MFQATKNTLSCNVEDLIDVVSGKQLHTKRKTSSVVYFFNTVRMRVEVFFDVCIGTNEAVIFLCVFDPVQKGFRCTGRLQIS